MPGYVDPYAGGSSGSSSSGGSGGRGYSDPYAGKAAAPSSHHGGGILGDIESAGHWAASKAGLAAHDIAGIPGGVYSIGKAVADTKPEVPGESLTKEWETFFTHPLRSFEQTKHAKGGSGAAVTGAISSIVNPSKQAVEHPLRDPFITATSLLPFAHVPFRAAEIARGADITAPRVLRAGDAEVPLPPMSRNAAVRAGQRAYGGVLNRALGRNPEGRVAAHAAKRIGGSLQETARYQARMRAVPASLLDQAGRELRGNIGKHVPFTNAKAAEAALRLTSENSTAEEAAAFHRAQAQKGVEPTANAKLARLYDHIAASDMLHQDERGNVAVNADKFPKLAAADKALARAQKESERIVTEHGLMTEEGQRARVNAPAQIRAGRYDVAHAQDRLAELDKWYRATLERIVPEVSQYGGDLSKREQLRRNYENSRAGKGNRIGADRQQTVKSEELALAADKLDELASKHAGEPWADTLHNLMDEREQLRDYLNRHAEAGMFGEGAAGLNGEGRGFVTYKPTEPKAPKNAMARSGSPVVGKTRSPIGAQAFSGKSLEQGAVPDNTTGLVARHLRALLRYVNTDQFRRQILTTGSDVRRTSRDILARIPEKQAGKIPLDIERELGRKTVTLDELEGHRQAIGDYIRHLIPGYNPDALVKDRFAEANTEARRYGIGDKAPAGFKWVDRNMLGDIGNAFSFSRGGAGRFADRVNTAVTLATVYLRPGHFPTRVMTNATAAIIQGSASPLELAKSVRLWHSLSHEDKLRALAAAGQHGYEAFPHESDFLKSGKAAQWWAKHADAPFRFSSLAYEARDAGYRTTASFKHLLDVLEDPGTFDKAEALKADAVAKEANRAQIAYDRLSDTEKRTIGRAVWFYPFMKASALYTGRVFAGHPYKASILANLGVAGRKQQQNVLGELPSYERGLIPLGHNRVTDLSTLTPFSAAGDLLNMPGHVGTSGLAQNLNPAASLLFDLATGTANGRTTNSPVLGAAEDAIASTPESQIAAAFFGRHADQSKRMFPKSEAWWGMHDPILRALLGAATPRTVNVPVANSAAARERAGK